MIEIIQKTIDFYTKNLKVPGFMDLWELWNINLERGSYFVTIYLKWEIRWSAWNVKEIKNTWIEELIASTISAISEDKRFKSLSINDAKEIKIRVDKIIDRKILTDRKIKDLDPTNSWVIVIKKDYSKLAVILPNINAKLFSWIDFIPVLREKLNDKKFDEKDYIVYEIKTQTETNF